MKLGNIAIAAIIIGVLVAGGYAYLAEISVETDGVGYSYRDITGGSNDNGGGDLLDTVAYVTSWSSGGASEAIVIQGHFRGTGLFEPSFARYWYIVSLEVNNPEVKINGVTGTEWTSASFEVPDFSNTYWYPMEQVIVFLTNPCHGKIHVELWGHVNDLNPWSSDDGLLAEDEAYLRDGLGTIKVQTDVVEEGDYLEFYVTTGYATSSKDNWPSDEEGWYVLIRNPAGTIVYTSNKIQDNWAGNMKWLVPIGSYRTTWDNTFEIVLRNELIAQDDDWAFVVGIGMIEDIPEKPSFNVIEGTEPYSKGEKITVRLSAEQTTYAVEGFTVWVSYETSAGSTTEYIYEKKFYPAYYSGGKYVAEVSWNFPDAGYCRLEASTLDVQKLNSGIAEMKFSVYYSPGGFDFGDNDWLGLVFGIIILILGFVFGILCIWKIPMPYGLLLGFAIIAAGVLIGLWMLLGSLSLMASEGMIALVSSELIA